jgi:hypothetical protein
VTREAATSHEDQYTFFIISCSLLVTMRNVLDNGCKENQNTHFMFRDQPRGLVVKVSDYWSWGPGFDSWFCHGDFSLKGKILMVTMVWVVWYFIFIYHHPLHRDNVTAPHGRPNLRRQLQFGHNREGGPQKSLVTRGGGKKLYVPYFFPKIAPCLR